LACLLFVPMKCGLPTMTTPDVKCPSPAICLVANELDTLGPGGGIGSSRWRLAHLLARHGWQVHVLHCAAAPSPAALSATRQRLAVSNIALIQLDEVAHSPLIDLPGYPHVREMVLSDCIAEALGALHLVHRFDLIVFTEWQALGLRTLQAKRAGMMLTDVGIIVSTHSMSRWMREGGGGWPVGLEELRLNFCEAEAFALADFQLSPTRYLLDYAREIGWQVRAGARVVRNALPVQDHVGHGLGTDLAPELVFFGRLERRKGLEIFLEALQAIDPSVPITFLGRDTTLHSGERASELICRRLAGRQMLLKGDCDREQALLYLSSGHRLAIIPSLLDNYPNTVQECAVNGIPFIAARVGGIPEMVADAELDEHLLFAPTAKDLGCCLSRYLAAKAEKWQHWRERVRAVVAGANHDEDVVAGYEHCLKEHRLSRGEARSAGLPLITVAVTHFNLGAFLPDALDSIASQTCSSMEVIVLDDGSTDKWSRAVFAEQERRYPGFRFLRQANGGLIAARNRLLAAAQGEFFLPVDADDLLVPEAVERMATALCHNPDSAAVSGYYLAFQEAAVLPPTLHSWAFRPTGGPLLLGGVENVWGGASLLYRTDVLRSLGGYREHPDNVNEDWHLQSRLVTAGHHICIVPCPVLHYRLRGDSRNHTVNLDVGQRFVLHDSLRNVQLTPADQEALWEAMTGFSRRLSHLEFLRVRLSDKLASTERKRDELREKLKERGQETKALRAELRLAQQPTLRRWRRRLVTSVRSLFSKQARPPAGDA
jgi:O-antigen biosynthesis protein